MCMITRKPVRHAGALCLISSGRAVPSTSIQSGFRCLCLITAFLLPCLQAICEGAVASDIEGTSLQSAIRFPDLMHFLQSIGKTDCYSRLAEQNFDVATLQCAVADEQHPVTPTMLKEAVGIPLGDAYAITRAIRHFAPVAQPYLEMPS